MGVIHIYWFRGDEASSGYYLIQSSVIHNLWHCGLRINKGHQNLFGVPIYVYTKACLRSVWQEFSRYLEDNRVLTDKDWPVNKAIDEQVKNNKPTLF